MSLLSSTTLFNFTDSFDHLKSNLINGIYSGTIYEKLPKKNNGYAVKMACFCDIPLSLIKEHIDWYGKFAIGISRTYARELGVSPLYYIHSDSKVLNTLIKNETPELSEILPFVKQFMGYQDFKGKPKRKKFYDEHEWRYIPPENNFQLFLKENRIKAEARMIKTNEFMPLDPASIEYLIIENSSYIDNLIEIIEEICRQHKSLKREYLIARIITYTQIKRDF